MQTEAFLVGVVQLDPALATHVAPHVRQLHLSRGDHLLRIGECQRSIGFHVSGVIRSYTLDEDGNEDTDCLVVEPGRILAHCGEFDEPSPINVEALTPSEVITLDLGLVKRLVASDPLASQFYIKALQDSLQAHWAIKTAITQNDARDRYLWFLEHYPGLEQEIPDRYIASFLKMTTVTLSRTRSSLRSSRG